MNFIVSKPKESEDPVPTLIIMHGYGADEYDLLPITSDLEKKFLTISLQAPIELTWGGYAWYHLEQTVEGLRGDDATRHESEKLLLNNLPQILNENNADPSNIYLMGFSQGAAMAYSLIGKYDLGSYGMNVHAVIAMSGYIPNDIEKDLQSKKLQGLPVFISHGEYDDLISPQSLKKAERVLKDAGASVTAKLYLTGHGITEDTISDINQWLSVL
jgi:phospholipase/carboxylesterase